MKNPSSSGSKLKFIIGGLLIAAAVIYLIVSSTQASAQYFLTIEELNQQKASYADREIRLSGAVIGESIQYDPQTMDLSFDVANIPADNKIIEKRGGLAQVLHDATLDESAPRLHVVYNGVRPDLLNNEAQAIMTGKLDAEGNFVASELLLKCPSKYEDQIPTQSQ